MFSIRPKSRALAAPNRTRLVGGVVGAILGIIPLPPATAGIVFDDGGCPPVREAKSELDEELEGKPRLKAYLAPLEEAEICRFEVILNAAIEPDLVDVLIDWLQPTAPTVELIFSLNSPGGDVAAAMELGRFLRARRAETRVMYTDRCESACVLVLAGGAKRNVWDAEPPADDEITEIGIHRPATRSEGVVEHTADDYAQLYGEVESAIGRYLDEMRIDPGLLRAMAKVPIEDVRYLTAREVRDFGLHGYDPAYYDWRRTQIATVAGKAWTRQILRVEREVTRSMRACDTPSCRSRILNSPLYARLEDLREQIFTRVPDRDEGWRILHELQEMGDF